MLYPYLGVGFVIVVFVLYGSNITIKGRRWMDWLSRLLLIPFIIWFFVSNHLGGSAFHKAAHDYPNYIPGHYYLMSHGIYTEVSAQVFFRMRAFQAMSLILFGISMIYTVLRRYNKNNKKRNTFNDDFPHL